MKPTPLKRSVLLLMASAAPACDRVLWHRFVVPDPVPDKLHVQYSNPECEPFPVVEGMVVIEYDERGCACTSTPENGAKWGPNAFTQRKPDGSFETLDDIRVVGGGTSYYDEVLQLTTKILRDSDEPESRLASFLEQCSHLPNVDELSRHESILRALQFKF